MNKKISKLLTVMLAIVLALGLTACSKKEEAKNSPTGENSDIEALLSAEPENSREAAELYQKLMKKEEDVLTGNMELWEKVFLLVDKDNITVGDDNNYGSFLLKIIEDGKDKFSEAEIKLLKAGAEQIKGLEEKLMALEEKYPDCTGAKGEESSVDADSAGMSGNGSEMQGFPEFQGKDLDGNDVNSSELFSGNTVTVVNFWFTTCKPCVGELGDLDALNNELAQKGGAVVGINAFTLDGDQDAILAAKEILSKKGASYKNIWFASDSDAGKFTSGLYAFPTTYVVDKNGAIIGQPIVGAITAAEQAEKLNALIDQALESSK